MIKTAIDKVISFDFNQAVKTGRLRKITELQGLSLGDRAHCPRYYYSL